MTVETGAVAGAVPAESRWAVLANRDFRLLWLFHVSNFLATGVEMLTGGWLVLEVSDSAFWVGAVAGVRGVGQIGFGLVGGHLADRYNRRAVAGLAQLARGVTVAVIALLALTGNIALWHLLAASFVQGLAMSMVHPAGEALIYDTVGPGRLLSAVALKMGAISVGRIPSALITGTAITALGSGATLLIAAALFLASPVFLIFVRPRFRQEIVEGAALRTIADGLVYIWRTRSLRSLLLFSVTMELFAFSYLIILPVLARDVLQVGANGLGVLSAVSSIGGVIATAVLSGLRNTGYRGTMLIGGSVATGVLILAIGQIPLFPAAIAFSLFLGAGFLVYDATMGTLLQVQARDSMRGRVLGLYGLTWGFMSLGGLITGSVASATSVPVALTISGIAVLLSVGLLVLVRGDLDRGPAG